MGFSVRSCWPYSISPAMLQPKPPIPPRQSTDRTVSSLNNSFFNICPEAVLLPFVHSLSPKACHPALIKQKMVINISFCQISHSHFTQGHDISPPYLQGVPNAKNSHLYSRLMFLQSNAEHISRLQGKTRGGEREGAKKKSRGGRHKGLSYFLCHLLASTFTAIPLHHVKDCKQANNNSVSETTERVQHPLSWRSLCHQLGREKTFVFIVHLNNIYLSLQREKVCARIYLNHCLWPG